MKFEEEISKRLNQLKKKKKKQNCEFIQSD